MDPVTDILYGSGYQSEKAIRYAWVLGLKERIPNEEVERRTEEYWRNMDQVGYARVNCAVAH